jgi:hypothetical protein
LLKDGKNKIEINRLATRLFSALEVDLVDWAVIALKIIDVGF